MENNVMERIQQQVLKFIKWRNDSSIIKKLLLSLVFALITGIFAQLSFTLSWTLVPITGQTFAVMLCAVFLGTWAGVSQILYAVLGFAGVPWFAGYKGGLASLQGPTAGYIYSFIIAAFIAGYCIDNYPRMRAFVPLVSLMIVVHFLVILTIGPAYMYFWKMLLKGETMGFSELLVKTVVPFIAATIIKSAAAAAIGHICLPKSR